LHRSEYTHDPVGAALHIGAVRDADAGHPKPAQAHVDQPLILDVEVRGALVEEKDVGLPGSARARSTRCFCPAESELPMSPTRLL
jgi:hypothetical protein